MPTRKSLVRSEAGVRLERIEHLSARGKVEHETYRLSTLRANPPRQLPDERSAQDAFDLEVIASLIDPVVLRLVDKGWRH